MHKEVKLRPPANNQDNDIERLHALGYRQVLARRLGGFSNFALSLSIICILAGGVTSFHLGLCSVGGASIGLGWPLVGLVALAVAATMAQLASTFPTAGGLYHWAAILGGRGWGWATAWFNLAGLITVLAAINVGTYRFALGALFPDVLSSDFNFVTQALAVGLITVTQAAINHVGIGVTARLTDFSGYWILLVAAVLTISLLAFAPGLEPSRLVTFRELQRDGRRKRLASNQCACITLCLGCALARVHDYRLRCLGPCRRRDYERCRKCATRHCPLGTGIDNRRLDLTLCRGHCCSQFTGSSRSRRRRISLDHKRRAPAIFGCCPGWCDCPGSVSLRIGHGYLCFPDGICLRTGWRAPLRTGDTLGLPQETYASGCNLDGRGDVNPVHHSYAGLRNDHSGLHYLSLHFIRVANHPGYLDIQANLDRHGSLGPRALVSAFGSAQRDWLYSANRRRHATSQRAIH